MFAVLMIVLNGVVGLCLLLGGLRHHEQAYNLQGAVAYLTVIIPLSVIALVLPNFTKTVPVGSLTFVQAAFFSLFTFLLYGIFLAIQTARNRDFFIEPDSSAEGAVAAVGRSGRRSARVGTIGWHVPPEVGLVGRTPNTCGNLRRDATCNGGLTVIQLHSNALKRHIGPFRVHATGDDVFASHLAD